MNNSTVNLIQRYYQAFNADDMETFLSLLSDDVAHDINQGKREIGKDAFKQFMTHMNHCYRERIRDLVVLSNAEGQRAAAEFIVDGQYLNTDSDLPEAKGQTYCLPAGAFFALHKGQITRVSNYYNLQEWLQQINA